MVNVPVGCANTVDKFDQCAHMFGALTASTKTVGDAATAMRRWTGEH